MNPMFIGVGGCGINLLEAWKNGLPESSAFIGVNRDSTRLKNLDGQMKTIRLLSADHVDVWSEELSTAEMQVKASMQMNFTQVNAFMDNHDSVVILAGLGGMTGSWATQVLAEYCIASRWSAVVMVTTPFCFERKRKHVAIEALQALKSLGCPVITYDNQDITKLYPNCSFSDALWRANKGFLNSYRAYIGELKQGGDNECRQ
ncbi:hypothetical protein FE236_02960 [Mariprofundus erugo]|uniref:hypothetical protein n=1 Tax=Mariprofundus erugo TaxID=2528639 RepID=UPI0010FF55FE|nr:hypothetical protein [Mariprofundus erugo]TLS77582.1 hypothetical protein FE236_02960 [Mariprofundus erugo]